MAQTTRRRSTPYPSRAHRARRRRLLILAVLILAAALGFLIGLLR